MGGNVLGQSRRRHRRLRAGGRAVFSYAGGRFRAHIEDISLSGLCAFSFDPPPTGAEVALDIPLYNGDVATARAEVVRSFTQGAAVRFHWQGEDDRSRLLLQKVLVG